MAGNQRCKWWAQQDLNLRPSDYELDSEGLSRVVASRNRLQNPCFCWFPRASDPPGATRHDHSRPKNWPRIGQARKAINSFKWASNDHGSGLCPPFARNLCSSYTCPLGGCAEMPFREDTYEGL